MLNELLERKITEAAEWFCDNPNCGDIEDALRELVAEAVSMENEACAKVCENLTIVPGMQHYTSTLCAAEIRMRSNA